MAVQRLGQFLPGGPDAWIFQSSQLLRVALPRQDSIDNPQSRLTTEATRNSKVSGPTNTRAAAMGAEKQEKRVLAAACYKQATPNGVKIRRIGESWNYIMSFSTKLPSEFTIQKSKIQIQKSFLPALHHSHA